jgi:endonuclease/exonuclease/phosphatase family metal-dependent hydrolase
MLSSLSAGRDLVATQATVDGRNDTRVASDHLPVIVRFDFVLR